jgi:hypothetical protein
MHLCFIDESGTPPKPNAKNALPYLVIEGVIMHENQWHGMASEVRQVCAKYRVTGEIKWRYFGAQNDDKSNSVAHLDQAARDAFRRDYFSILTKRKSVRVVACVASTAAAYATKYVKDADDLYHFTYKPVSERFQYHLQDLSRSVGDKQLGIVVADHRGRRQDDDFRADHLDLVQEERTFVSKYENFVECVFLTPSHMSVGVQTADMVAGAIGRNFNSRDPTFFDAIYPSFRTSAQGKIDGFGLVKFPKGSWS